MKWYWWRRWEQSGLKSPAGCSSRISIPSAVRRPLSIAFCLRSGGIAYRSYDWYSACSGRTWRSSIPFWHVLVYRSSFCAKFSVFYSPCLYGTMSHLLLESSLSPTALFFDEEASPSDKFVLLITAALARRRFSEVLEYRNGRFSTFFASYSLLPVCQIFNLRFAMIFEKQDSFGYSTFVS